MPPDPIQDPLDSRLDAFRQLPGRPTGGGEVVAESELAVGRWLSSGLPVRAVLTTAERWPRLQPLAPASLEVLLAPIDVIRQVVGFPLRRGVVACGPRPAPPAPQPAGEHRVVVAQGLSDPRNLGALVRNCRAFGVHEVVVTPSSADPYSRRAIRASAGHVFELPVRVESLAAAEGRLAGLEWIATSPSAARVLSDLRPGPRWALVVGNEGAGISPELLERCRTRVRIPLAAGVDSLNVAAATAVCLHALCPPPG